MVIVIIVSHVRNKIVFVLLYIWSRDVGKIFSQGENLVAQVKKLVKVI